MPFESLPESTERYGLLSFDKDGAERNDDPDGADGLFSARLLHDLRQVNPTDVFFFSHGWNGDVRAARDQYGRWIKAMLDLQSDRAAMGSAFRPYWIGLHWPSLPFGDEELGGTSFGADDDNAARPSPQQLVELYLERLGLDDQSRPLIQTIVEEDRRNAAATNLPATVKEAYIRLAELCGRNQELEFAGPPDVDGDPFDPATAFDLGNAAGGGTGFGDGGFVGGILGPLRQLSYWRMKKRARSIGESGMHSFIAALMNAAPATRVHLMGHSFGCIVVSSILGGKDAKQSLPRPVHSLALVQGAVSLWAFAGAIPRFSGAGYFNPWIARKAVRGPIVVTRSRFDRAVGVFYPLASATVLAQPDFDAEESDLPRWGAIGAYGARGLAPEAVDREMLPENGGYGFEPGKIYNLESSKYIRKGGGFSGAHSDIDGPQVAHAIWQAASG